MTPDRLDERSPWRDNIERDLFRFLEGLEIRTVTHQHPPVRTVSESQTIKIEIPGAHTKNLFLKDKNDSLLLISASAETTIALNRLHRSIGMQRLSFASPERLLARLGVTPGSVSGFCLLNDVVRPGGEARVRFVLDHRLLQADLLNFHPLRNDMTTTIGRDDFLKFCAATGHDIEAVDFGGL